MAGKNTNEKPIDKLYLKKISDNHEISCRSICKW